MPPRSSIAHRLAATLTIALPLAACGSRGDSPAAGALTPAEARAIAKEAYIYGFPLVDNYRITWAYFVDSAGPTFTAPWNQIHNTARVYTPADTTIQTPNSDTPYSMAGLDLRAEPMVIKLPAVDPKRYYSVQLVDAYTFNFAYLGSRTTGNEAGSYLIAGPGWKGELPAGIKAILPSETEFVLAIIRTQLFNPADLENVKQVQAGYKVQPLSQFLGTTPPPAAPAVAWRTPLSAEQEKASPEVFDVLAFALQYCPVDSSETALRARFAKLGIEPGKKFDPAALSPEVRAAVDSGIADAWGAYEALYKDSVVTGKLSTGAVFGTRAHLRNNYLYRMAAAKLGIYGNSAEEALYPSYHVDTEGKPLDGTAGAYTLRFAPGQLPPVDAFWSLTMYEMPKSLLYANPLDRYLINSPMLPQLKKDADGGITLYLQHESPGKARESNWLPEPAGPFAAFLRLYRPRAEVLNGTWKQPPMERVAK